MLILTQISVINMRICDVLLNFFVSVYMTEISLHIRKTPINSNSTQLFEAIISSAGSFLQLHASTPSNAYNVRSVSTNDNETLHGLEEAILKPFRGVPSVKHLEIVKSKTMEISAILNDPGINFPIRHAKCAVYSAVLLAEFTSSHNESLIIPNHLLTLKVLW